MALVQMKLKLHAADMKLASDDLNTETRCYLVYLIPNNSIPLQSLCRTDSVSHKLTLKT